MEDNDHMIIIVVVNGDAIKVMIYVINMINSPLFLHVLLDHIGVVFVRGRTVLR